MAKGDVKSDYGKQTLDEWASRVGVSYDELVDHVDEVRNRPSSYSSAKFVTPQRSRIQSEKMVGSMLHFLNEYHNTHLVVQAAKAAGVSTSSVRYWRREFPLFDNLCSEIQETIADVCEDELYRRAIVGEEKNIYHQGQVVDIIKEKSNDLLKLMLTSNRPKYRAKSEVAMTGAGGGPIQMQVEDVNITGLREKLLEKLLAKQAEVLPPVTQPKSKEGPRKAKE